MITQCSDKESFSYLFFLCQKTNWLMPILFFWHILKDTWFNEMLSTRVDVFILCQNKVVTKLAPF